MSFPKHDLSTDLTVFSLLSTQAGVYPNVFAAARSIVGAAGPRGLFTGFLPTLLEDVPDMAIKFAAYESMRQVRPRGWEQCVSPGLHQVNSLGWVRQTGLPLLSVQQQQHPGT
jgi:hypothetical protein